MPKASIVAIIPLYNGEHYIETAINAVLNQSHPVDEFVVVDDGSTDSGPAIVENICQRHPVMLLRKRNGGQSSARNYGVMRSTSELIAFLDQDDAWYPNHLTELVKPFQKGHPAALGWSYSNLDEIDGKGNFVNRGVLSLLPISHPKKYLTNCLREDMFILPSASLISRKAFDSVGGFDERLSGYEDDDLFLRMFRAGWDNVYIDKSLSQWRIYTGSSSFSARMGKSRMIYFEKLCAQYPDDSQRKMFYIRDCLAPRFIKNIFFDYTYAIAAGKDDRVVSAAKDLSLVAKYLRGYRRAATRLLSIALSSPRIGRCAIGVQKFLRAIGLSRIAIKFPF
jgi:glycosyltransferase involved in cell wall biosynthesis